MKIKTIAAAIMAMSVASSGFALAKDKDDRDDRGHQWVQIGGDYVLVAIATGIIVQLLLNH